MALRLGKKPARPNAIRLKFGTFFSSMELPAPPLVFGRPDLVRRWGMLANDEHSCCIYSGGPHETMLWRAWAGLPIPQFTDATTLADYAAVTGFNPADPSTDQGGDMQEAASYRRKIGLIDAAGERHRIDSYVALKAGDLDELALATFTLGAVGLGLEMPSSAMDQFDRAEPWDVIANSPTEGGHYVPCISRNSHGNFLVVTWNRLHAVTPRFIAKYMDEGVAYLSLEQIRTTGVSPRGFDEAGLHQALRQIG
jgi:hypothetical protein